MTKQLGGRVGILMTACAMVVLIYFGASMAWDDARPASAAGDIPLGEAIRLPHTESLRGPDVADLDGDGRLDLVSGSYEGRIFFSQQAEGSPSLEFRMEKPLRTAATGDAKAKDIDINHW